MRVALAGVLGSLAWVGCGAPTITGGTTTGSGSTTGSGFLSPTSGGLTTSGGVLPPSGQLEVLPASPSLQVQSGTPSTLQLQAVVVGSGGGSTPVAAQWSSGRSDIAAIGIASGLVTASGPLGGPVEITATWNGQTATALLQIVVTQTIFVGGLPSSVQTTFSGAPTASAASPQFIYPADGTIIPVNLDPMNFQWQPGAGNALFRFAMTGPFGTLEAYVQPAPNSAGVLQPQWQPDPTNWHAFAQNNIGQTVTLSVEAATAAGAATFTAGPTQELTLAPSRFAGTIYYWNIGGGEILRLDPGGATPQVVYTPPPQPASAGVAGGSTCLACHSISADGTKLAAEAYGGGFPGVVVNLAQSPAVAIVPPGSEDWYFSAFDPTGTLLLTSLNGQLTLRDSSTTMPSPAGSGEGNQGAIGCGQGGLCTQPNWTRDGALMAFAQGLQSASGQTFSNDVDFAETDLMETNWDATTQTFGTPTLLVAHDFDGQELANFYPSFSVDDTLLSFTRSACSYRSDGACPGLPTKDELLIVPATGGTPIELVTAEGGDDRNRYPNFSPFKEGGYHWMTFYSQRDYGFVTQGLGIRQVWVTAIDDTGTPTADPSHPAFWLPGQDPTTENDRAEWATLPCVNQGAGCQGDIDCCTGLVCRTVSDGGSECLPAASACGYIGDACQTTGDCCTPFVCSSGQCSVSFE